jgi:hypothetical protein
LKFHETRTNLVELGNVVERYIPDIAAKTISNH